MKVDLISKKKSHQYNLIRLGCCNGNKIIFTLLTKVTTFYMRPIIIDVRQSGLESLVFGFLL